MVMVVSWIYRFFDRLEMLFGEGLGPWIALIGFEFMVIAAFCQAA